MRTAVQAVLNKLAADSAADQALAQRDAAYLELYREHGWSQPKIEREMRKALIDAGLSEEQTRGVGVGHDTIRNVVGRRRRG